MTQNIQISAKSNDGTILVVGGNDIDEFNTNVAALKLDVDDIHARFSVLAGVGDAPTLVRQATGPGTTHVPGPPPAQQDGNVWGQHNSGSVPPPPPSYNGGGQQGGTQRNYQKYPDRFYFHIGPRDQALRNWAKSELNASFDKEGPDDKLWYVSPKYSTEEQVAAARARFGG